MTGPVQLVVRPTTSPRWVGRAAWSVCSQALSSATNFGLSAALLLTVSADELGRVLSVVAVYLLALTLSRSLVTEPMVASADDRARGSKPWPEARVEILRMAVVAVAASLIVGVGLGVDRSTLALLVLPLPLLLLQDAQRYRLMAADAHRGAAVLDALWLLASALLLGALGLSGGGMSATMVVCSWVGGGMASALLGLALTRSLPHGPAEPAHGHNDDAVDRPTSDPYRTIAHSQAVAVIAVNLAPIVTAAALSPAMAGAARALLLPFAVILSLTAGVRVVTMPAVRAAIDDGRADRLLGRLAGALVAMTAVTSVAIVWIIGLIGPSRLGQTTELVAPYLLLGATLCTLYVLIQQLADAVALTGHPDAPFRRAVGTAMEWAGLFAGAGLAGVGGMLIGWTVGLSAAACYWLVLWLRR